MLRIGSFALFAFVLPACAAAASKGGDTSPASDEAAVAETHATPSTPSRSPGGNTDSPAAPAPGPTAPLALVYRGPVVGCDGCSESIADVLKASKHGFQVEFVGPNEPKKLSAETLATASLYAQPGGDGDVGEASKIVLAALGGAQVMADWVKAGGRYYGTCMGGYLAANPSGSFPKISDRAWQGFGLLPGKAGEWIASSGASVRNERDTVVEVTWRGKSRWVYFQDGPHFELDAGADATVLATYESNGLPAAVVAPLGKGKVGVVGPHPEADSSWFADENLSDPGDPQGTNGHANDLALDLIDTLMQ